MKTKNWMMAMIAFTFAIGSAFASMFALEDVYVKAKTSALGSAQCIKTTGRCDNSGSLACQVSVPVSHGPSPVTASSTGTFKTFRATNCTTILTDINGGIQNVTPEQTIYELVQ